MSVTARALNLVRAFGRGARCAKPAGQEVGQRMQRKPEGGSSSLSSPGRWASTRHCHRRRPRDCIQAKRAPIVHPKGWDGPFPESERRPRPKATACGRGGRRQESYGRSLDVRCRLYQKRRRRRPINICLQRRSGFRDGLVHMGAFGAAPHCHGDRCTHPGAPYSSSIPRSSLLSKPTRLQRRTRHRFSGSPAKTRKKPSSASIRTPSDR